MSRQAVVECWERNLGPLPEPYRSVWIEQGFQGYGFDIEPSEVPLNEPVSRPVAVMAEREARMTKAPYKIPLEQILYGPSKLGVRMEPDERHNPGDFFKWIEGQIPADEAALLFDL